MMNKEIRKMRLENRIQKIMSRGTYIKQNGVLRKLKRQLQSYNESVV